MKINYTKQEYERLALNSARVIAYLESTPDRPLALQIMRDQGLKYKHWRKLAVMRRHYRQLSQQRDQVFKIYVGKKRYDKRAEWIALGKRLSMIRRAADAYYNQSFMAQAGD